MKTFSIFAAGLILAAAALAQAPNPNAPAVPAVKRQAMNVLRAASAVSDGETVTIGTVVYEVDTASTPTITAGNIRLNLNAAQTAAAFTTALEAAVNATNVSGFRVKASRISANEVLFVNYGPPGTPLAVSETLAGTNNAWAAAAFFGGSQKLESQRPVLAISRAATAVEAALLTMHFVAPFTPGAALVQVQSSAGALKAFDGSVTISGAIVNVVSGGSITVASGDVVTIIVTQ